jgi:carboxyl-terminal processing protease
MKMQKLVKAMFGSVVALGAYAADGASPDPWSYELVSSHPRWISFVQEVEKSYVTPVSEAQLSAVCRKYLELTKDAPKGTPVDTCITSALHALDRQSIYIPPEEFTRQQSIAHKFVGIGLELVPEKPRGKPMRVVQPIGNSPAERAGILAADEILEINGVDVLPLSIDEFFQVMRGEAGTVVRLRLLRNGINQPVEVSAKREEIRVSTVKAQWLSKDMAYLRVSQMRAETPNELRRKITALLVSRDKPPAGLIIDLRSNPGGTLDSILPIASLFSTPDIEAIIISGREGVRVQRTTDVPLEDISDYKASVIRQSLKSTPKIVLIDRKTSGGAEAIAAFLRDRSSSKLMGERTFGAPEVRTYFQLGTDSAMRLTTARMLSSTGKGWADGLVPDIPLGKQDSQFEWASSSDTGVQRAIAELQGEVLNGAFKGGLPPRLQPVGTASTLPGAPTSVP